MPARVPFCVSVHRASTCKSRKNRWPTKSRRRRSWYVVCVCSARFRFRDVHAIILENGLHQDVYFYRGKKEARNTRRHSLSVSLFSSTLYTHMMHICVRKEKNRKFFSLFGCLVPFNERAANAVKRHHRLYVLQGNGTFSLLSLYMCHVCLCMNERALQAFLSLTFRLSAARLLSTSGRRPKEGRKNVRRKWLS